MPNNDEDERLKCTECHRQLDLGKELLTLEEAMVGPRGVVPLADPKVFCSAKCLRQYVNGNEHDPQELQRRVP